MPFSDEQTKSYQGSTYKFGTHYTAASAILGALGVSLTDAYAEEDECFACHSTSAEGLKAVANMDWYNQTAMDATSQSIRGLMAGTPATAQTQTNTLYFRPTADGAPSEPMPNAHQTGDTFASGTWIGRAMAPNASTIAYETKTQSWAPHGQLSDGELHLAAGRDWHAPIGAGNWTININAMESNYGRQRLRPLHGLQVERGRLDRHRDQGRDDPHDRNRHHRCAAHSRRSRSPAPPSPLPLVTRSRCASRSTRPSTTSYNGSFYFGSGAPGNLALPSPVNFTWASPATTPASVHNVAGYSGVHKPSPTDETQAYISANKHVECADCHGVHAATTASHTQRPDDALGCPERSHRR